MTDLIERTTGQCLCTLYGTITAIDEEAETASVNLDSGGSLADVPIFYHCQNGKRTKQATAFTHGDKVKLISVNDGSGFLPGSTCVVGFWDGNRKPCVLPKCVVKVMFGGYAFMWEMSRDRFYPDGVLNILPEDDLDDLINEEISVGNLRKVVNDPLFWFYSDGETLYDGYTLNQINIPWSECPEFEASACSICSHSWDGDKTAWGYAAVLNKDLFPAETTSGKLYEVNTIYGSAYFNGCPEECTDMPQSPEYKYTETYYEFWTPIGKITEFSSDNLRRGEIYSIDDIQWKTVSFCGGYGGPGYQSYPWYESFKDYYYYSNNDDDVGGGTRKRYYYPLSKIINSDIFVNIFMIQGNSYFWESRSGSHPPVFTLTAVAPREDAEVLVNYGSIVNGDNPFTIANELPLENLTQAVKSLINHAYSQTDVESWMVLFDYPEDVSMEIFDNLEAVP